MEEIIREKGLSAVESSIGKLKNPEYFNTWFTRIVINCSINQLNKMKKVVPLVDDDFAVAASTGISKEESVDLYSAIDKLKPEEKTIVILMYIEGFTLKEIASMLNIPLGTVKTRLNRALKTLRVKLEV
ncbi:MAG: sigma-70 family RNA polymerase sigma factor [Firmicutes bacterium]|nr:sigma-70 family RNA polymerase sigma factor [Bacillota bacterium]